VSIDPTYRTTTPEYAVSWDGTAAFTGTYDILAGRVLNNTLAIQYGRDSAKPLGESLIPTATWVAWNADRLLSPEWAGSPLYQLILPGKPTRVSFFVGSDVTDYDSGHGRLRRAALVRRAFGRRAAPRTARQAEL
jgi:hypothetical protein